MYLQGKVEARTAIKISGIKNSTIMKEINIGVKIDIERLLKTRMLIQASSGGGKSGVIRKLCEEAAGKVQIIALDIEGEMATLREEYDFALVGKEGDIPINIRYAEALAHKLLETNISTIVDLYELQQHERIRFVKEFLNAMINAPKKLWHSCLVIVDEAHLFCPESSKCDSTAAVIDLCTRGRKRGFAAVLATQRLSKLHKDAAAECMNKLIGRTGLDIDRDRAGKELGWRTNSESLQLRNLKEREFYAFGPAISTEVIKFRTGTCKTSFPESGAMVTNPPTPNAVKKIINKLEGIPLEAENELKDKEDMRKEITRLRSELTRAKNEQEVDEDEIERRVKIVKVELAKLYDKALKERDKEILRIADIVANSRGLLNAYEYNQQLTKVEPDISIKDILENAVKNHPVYKAREHLNKITDPVLTYTTVAKTEPVNGEFKLTSKQQDILDALAWYESLNNFSPSAIQVGAVALIDPNGGYFSNVVGPLSNNGLITRGGGAIMLTDLGRGFAKQIEKAGTLEDYHNVLRARLRKMKSAGGKTIEIFNVIAAAKGMQVSTEQIGREAGIDPSGGYFSNVIGPLSTAGLIKRANGMVMPTEVMFPEGLI